MTTPLREHDITVDGARIHYYHLPAPGQPALVLQHGFSDNGLCWAPVAEELAGAYDIYMPDARGHGLSARVQRGEQIDQPAELAALLRALGLERVIAAGHSMGAQMAGAFGARFPEMARALVLEDPPWFQPPAGAPPPSGPRPPMQQTPMGRSMLEMMAKPYQQLVDETRAEHPNWLEAYVAAWCLGKTQLDRAFLAADNRWEGWRAHAAAIQCPTLLITADPAMGGIVTPALAEQVAQQNPRIQVVNFAGVGHHIRFAVHHAYMQALRAFLAGLG